MIKQENVNKVGYGSWYSTQAYDGDKSSKDSFMEFFREKNRVCYERIASETKVGDKVRITYVGGNKIMRYTGIVKDLWFDEKMVDGYLTLQQSKQAKGFYPCFVDEVEILEEG